MRALHHKLFRELMRLWPQALAIALVMAAGVATLIIGVGTYQSLEQTRSAYYQANRFADLFATVTRAPRSLLDRIAAIDGVLAADGRINQLAVADLESLAEPATALLVSLPAAGEGELNRLYLRSGRLPESGGPLEAAVSEVFADANGLRPGSHVGIVVNGVLRDVTVTGIALSPEYVYAMAPGEILPTEGRFGILWLREGDLAAAYDLVGAFNSLAVKLAPGAPEERIRAAIDILLEPYGGQGAYGRAHQVSNAYLDAELEQLRAMSQVLPPIFLLVAAFLVSMTLGRLIALEREQIGLFKALGYSARAIGWHYVEFALIIAIGGIAIGFALGIWAGGALTVLYAQYFSFPILVFSREPGLYALAAAVTLAAAVAGALRAVRKAVRLPPAVAMLPPPPPVYRRILGGLGRRGRAIRKTWLMVLRHLLHWPWRTAGGVLGVSLSTAILVGTLWTYGAVEHMIDYTFNRTERQDATLSFLGPRDASAIREIERLPGVLRAEAFRSVPVEMRHAHVTRRVAITGRQSGTDLSRLLDADGRPVAMPETGLLLSAPLARILGVTAGESVEVTPLEGQRRVTRVPVAEIVGGYLGLAAYADFDALNAMLGEGPRISGAGIAYDPLRHDALYAVLKSTPSLGHISLRSTALEQFRETMAESLFIMIGVLVGLAGIIAFGVVYNFARVSLSEQGREMASLRVLGFRRGEVANLLLAEIAVVTLVAQPIGWGIGSAIAQGMVEGFSSELFTMPLVLGPDVLAYSSLVVAAAALVSGLAVRRRVDRLDMIAVLKTRE